MHGFTGRILAVDLGTQDIQVIERDRDFYRRYLGGGYLAARLFRETLADSDPPAEDDSGRGGDRQDLSRSNPVRQQLSRV